MNKYWAKTLKITCIVLFLTTGANLFSSCNDDLPADSYYTFTGEMMSDFLQTREDFSLFRRIVERAGKMDFLGSRGARTLFPPINSGCTTPFSTESFFSLLIMAALRLMMLRVMWSASTVSPSV